MSENDNINPKKLKELQALLKKTELDFKKFEKSYFWESPKSASARRSYESKNSWTESIKSFKYNTSKTSRTFNVKVNFDVSCSAKNIYVNKSILINGTKVNIAKFRGFVNKIKQGKPIPFSYIP